MLLSFPGPSSLLIGYVEREGEAANVNLPLLLAKLFAIESPTTLLADARVAGAWRTCLCSHVTVPSPFCSLQVRRNGLGRPVQILDRTGLGFNLPGPKFTVRDVADIIGHDYPLDVIDVASQVRQAAHTLHFVLCLLPFTVVRACFITVCTMVLQGGKHA